MQVDKVLKAFVPKDNVFFPIFEQDSENLINAAEQLKQLMSSNGSAIHCQIINRIKEFEKNGNEITDRIYHQLNESFITPFEREDIHQLAKKIDDVLDAINRIARGFSFYQPEMLEPVYREMASVICQATAKIGMCLSYLKYADNNKKAIMKVCEDINVLEQIADEIFYSGISDLMANENKIIDLIKNKEILENLKKCFDATDAVLLTIKSILIKIS